MKIKYIKYIGILSIAMLLASCDEKETIIIEEPDDIEEPTQEESVTVLSAEELANCYIVKEPGKYKFLADNQFNLGVGLPTPPKITPTHASLIWQTAKGLIEGVELINENGKPYVVFEVKEAMGNALISVENGNGEIAWSWHIWMPKEDVEGIRTSTGYEVMNMNLGALSSTGGVPESYGMLYQWGRKDPFPASATLTGDTQTVGAPLYDINGKEVAISNSDWTSNANNTITYSISHPTVCLSNYSQYGITRDWLKDGSSDDSLWGNPEGDLKDEANNYINKGVKTCYDPSPAGWRVAPADVFSDFTTSGGYAWDFEDFNIKDINNDGLLNNEDYNYGWWFMVNSTEALYFPAASRYDGSYAMLMGSMSGYWGNYWSNSPSSSIQGGGLAALAFQVMDMTGNEMVSISPSASGSKADAYSIRCIRDN